MDSVTLASIAAGELRPLILTLATTVNIFRFIPQLQTGEDVRNQVYYAAKMGLCGVHMALAEVINRMELIEVNNQRSN